MSTIAWDAATRAELFVRSDLPWPVRQCRETTTSRLEHLVASDVLESFSVTSWAKRVPVADASESGRFERDLYRRFSDWARSAGVRLTPFFDTRECYSSTNGQRRTELVLPAVCLALYDGADLVAVVPHADETGSVSVRAGLELLEDESRDEPTVSPPLAD